MAKTDRPVALVTGASRGLGRGVALELAKAGFSVGINYAGNRKAAEETQAACREIAPSTDQQFEIFQADIGKREDRERLVTEAWSTFGYLDALVNNAGIAPRIRADILEASEESFEELIRINLQGPYFLTQMVARRWVKEKPSSRVLGGFKIVFVTSISADTASIQRGEYCISKAGLAMAVKLWASRLAEAGIQVYELRPGIMATDMTSGVKTKYDTLIEQGLVPQKRWGTPEDVGKAVRSLLEGDFPFSTGSVIHIDGGFHVSRL
ncbi:MAG: 3-ketoacyl-ACP reductase [Spirochaetes bacterium]|nr:3-ketoacyl-ACP reductase [Spirochaetota bacterium]